jgi:acetyltransferase-like isoleucine patch superfamily enzyme
MNFAKIKQGVYNPYSAFVYLKMIAKGYYYKTKFKLLNQNVRIGRNFKVVRKLSIRGPGQVIIGDNVFVDGTIHTVTPWTHDRNSTIIIGNNVYLNGTRFGCKKRIDVGDECILADCRILDTDFHSIYPDRRHDPDYIQSSPIKIGKNVWIGLGCVILRGVTIGNGSTISALSVVCSDVPEYSCYGGNPAVLIKNIPKFQMNETENS